MFICAHCPFVKYIENQIFTLSKEIANTVQTVAISSNDIVTHPSDTPENLRLKHNHKDGVSLIYSMKIKNLLRH